MKARQRGDGTGRPVRWARPRGSGSERPPTKAQAEAVILRLARIGLLRNTGMRDGKLLWTRVVITPENEHELRANLEAVLREEGHSAEEAVALATDELREWFAAQGGLRPPGETTW